MKIAFTKHAESKFRILEEHGFRVTKGQVENTVNMPDNITKSEKDRFIAQRPISKTHVLRVVYRESGDTIRVITFYPARRQRYEH